MLNKIKSTGNLLLVLATPTQKPTKTAISELINALTRSLSDLKSNKKAFKLLTTGLSTQLTSRWIKHPQAFPSTGKLNNLLSIIRLNGLVISCFYTNFIKTVLGARIESQRKRSHFAFLCWQCFEATQSTFVNSVSTGKPL